MNALTDVQMIRDAKGRAAFAVLPITDYEMLLAQSRVARMQAEALIPHEVISVMVDGASAARAWREHRRLTQAEVAGRMGITQAALAQMEAAARPRKASRAKLATALGLDEEQLVSA